MQLIYPAHILLTFRNIVPLMDLHDKPERCKSGNSQLLFTTQVISMIYCITIIVSLNYKHKWAYASFFTSGIAYSLINNYYQREDLEDPDNYIFAGFLITASSAAQFLFFYFQSIVGEEINFVFNLREKQKRELQAILDNVDEGIVIKDLEEKKIEYFNDYITKSLKSSRKRRGSMNWNEDRILTEYSSSEGDRALKEYRKMSINDLIDTEVARN